MQHEVEQAAQEAYSRDDIQEDEDVVGVKSRKNNNGRLPLAISSEEDDAGGYVVQRVDASSFGGSKASKAMSHANLTK